MLWFKHMSNMRNDVKIKRLILKFGLEGYGLYNLILESITENLSAKNCIPDLQETCEDIAEFYNGNTSKIEEMVRFMIDQELIEAQVEGIITCKKIYAFLESNSTSSKQLRSMISAYKKSHESQTKKIPSQDVVTESQEVETGSQATETASQQNVNRREEKRKEEIRREENRRDKRNFCSSDFVLLTDEEFDCCLLNYGLKQTEIAIKKLDDWFLSVAKEKRESYESHFHCLESWVWGAIGATKVEPDKPYKRPDHWSIEKLEMPKGFLIKAIKGVN